MVGGGGSEGREASFSGRDVKGDLAAVGFAEFGVEEDGGESVRARCHVRGAMCLGADVHGEFKFPAHRFDETGRAAGGALGVGQFKFEAGALEEGGEFEGDAHAAAVGVGGGAQVEEAHRFGREAFEVWVEEEGVHGGNYSRVEGGGG